MTVHAHPDDEASKGPGTVSLYRERGVHTVLVCATGGEEGDILNPEMDRPEVRDDLARVRREELERSVEIIGYHELVMLGYRDSGMVDSDANAHPDCLAAAPPDEPVGRLVEVIRRVRPQVIITYPDGRDGYNHPDHVAVHDATLAAFFASGNPDRFPHLGEPFSPSKLYFVAWPRRRMLAMHQAFLANGLESPFDEEWVERMQHDEPITTSVPLGRHSLVRRDSLRAHRTQIDPNSRFWFGLPEAIEAEVYPFDDYLLAHSLVGDSMESSGDLFAGVHSLERSHQLGVSANQ